MNGTINDRYFEWLYGKVASVRNRNPARSYWALFKELYCTQFDGYVPNDHNRVEDGKDLRHEFISRWGDDDVDQYWLALDCSMLEMFVALADRVSFESSGTPDQWFWKLMENLELAGFTDDIWEISLEETTKEVMKRINERTYGRDGSGGIFPLRHAHADQRDVEIWYQMSAYLLEGQHVGVHARH